MAQRPDIQVTYMTEATGGGVRHHLRRVIPGIRSRGVGIDLIVSDSRADPDFAEDLDAYRSMGCRTHVVPVARGLAPWSDVQALRATRHCLREWAPDILHTHAAKAGILGRLAARANPELRAVHSPHAFFFLDFPDAPRRWLGIRLERWLARRTHCYVCVSHAERDLAARVCHIPDGKLVLAVNGLAPEHSRELVERGAARRRLGIEEGIFAVAVVGRLARQKGHDWFLRALTRFPPDTPHIQVLLLGDGPEHAHLHALVHSLDLGERVRWLGYVPRAATLMRGFDLIAIPSRYEGLSYTLLEALAAGVPVVAADAPGNLPHPQLHACTEAVPFGDERALAEAIVRLAREPDRRQKLAAAGQRAVHQHFRLDQQVSALVDLYRSLVT